MRFRHSDSVRPLGLHVGLILMAAFSAAIGPSQTMRAESSAMPSDVQVGWDGHLVLGAWTSVSTSVTIREPGTYRLDVSATDPDGNFARFQGEELHLEPGSQRVTGRFQLGRADGEIRLLILQNGELVTGAMQNASLPATAFTPHRDSERLLVTVGLSADLQSHFAPTASGRWTVLHLADPSKLPDDALNYECVHGLLLAGKKLPNELQSAAIEEWVRRGGRLWFSAGLPPAQLNDSALVRRFPLTIATEPIATRELTSLESYAGKTIRIVPPGQRVMIPKVTFSFGKTWAGYRSDPVLVQVPWSFGSVMFLGMDITAAPLKAWPGVGDLLRKMTDVSETSEQAGGRSQQLGSTGITDMASQIAAALEDFTPVSRTSPWWVLGALVVLLALVGPFDYWLVDRVWKRPLSTWISFPAILAVCAGVAIWAAHRTNGPQVLVNQLAVVDVDAASNFVRARHWATLYSPDSRRYQLACQPAWPEWNQPSAEEVQLTAGWCGLPESSFGGMHRSGAAGLQFGSVTYGISPNQGTWTDVPAAQWSTVALEAASSGTQPGLVESKLESTATGRLSGTVLHRLPGDLTDWFVAYENRVYRQLERDQTDVVVPLRPQQTFRLDQRAVTQRELRSHLTRTTARQVGHGSTNTRIVLQQASYDPLTRNLSLILPLWSFHGKIEGATYTGLKNDALAELDLTPLLDLDRAMLIGFLQEPASETTVVSAPNTAGRRTTLIRLVLPVDRSRQTLRDLPKFEKK